MGTSYASPESPLDSFFSPQVNRHPGETRVYLDNLDVGLRTQKPTTVIDSIPIFFLVTLSLSSSPNT